MRPYQTRLAYTVTELGDWALQCMQRPLQISICAATLLNRINYVSYIIYSFGDLFKFVSLKNQNQGKDSHANQYSL